MSQPNTDLDQLERSLDMTSAIVDRINQTQWTDHSPWAGGEVREVPNRAVGGMRILAAELTGQDGRAMAAADIHPEALVHGTAVDAYRVPGVFGPEVAAPADAAAHERPADSRRPDLQRVSAGVAS